MNIIITGASRGIGRETALEFSKDRSNRILALARSTDLLTSLSKAARFNNISFEVFDINSITKSPQKLLKRVSDEFEYVDILINNAGSLISSPFELLTPEDDYSVISTNFISPMHLIRALLPNFSPRGHVVNISSMSGFQGSSKYPGLSVYGAAKGALAILTESLASEYMEGGPSFNCLSLGAVQTEMLQEAFPGYRAPLKPDEIAQFITWFATNGNRYFNGRNLPVALANPKD